MTTSINPIYLGTRGAPFKSLITGLLTKGNISPKYMKALTDNDSMRKYEQSFTATSADATNNYEMFEQLGDLYANSFIVWYAYRRFPQLVCPNGVKVVARLRINYGAKQSFHNIADKLGFWPFISASYEQRGKNKKSLLEDTLESFCGVTAYIIDKRTRPGVGYAIVYDILASIFDDIPISLEYEDLYDPKTRLKETFDKFRADLGNVDYTFEYTDMYTTATAWKLPHKKAPRETWVAIGTGRASGQKDAEQKASLEGLETLKANGFFKEPPPEYKFFCR